jgi:hypothetical protein
MGLASREPILLITALVLLAAEAPLAWLTQGRQSAGARARAATEPATA